MTIAVPEVCVQALENVPSRAILREILEQGSMFLPSAMTAANTLKAMAQRRSPVLGPVCITGCYFLAESERIMWSSLNPVTQTPTVNQTDIEPVSSIVAPPLKLTAGVTAILAAVKIQFTHPVSQGFLPSTVSALYLIFSRRFVQLPLQQGSGA